MTYSVYQHWDPLKVMVVGTSYPPELYDYIKNEKVRKVFYKIAEETEEDYQKLISLLKSFNVKVIRTNTDFEVDQAKWAIKNNEIIPRPWMMQPRDSCIMLGEEFCCYDHPTFKATLEDVKNAGNKISYYEYDGHLAVGEFKFPNNVIEPAYINSAMTTRVGKDLYVGTLSVSAMSGDIAQIEKSLQNRFPNYRVTGVRTGGHADGCFCPVVPGLILSIIGLDSYTETFPGWEVVYLPGESWGKIKEWIRLKKINGGKWWMPGEELNDDFTNYVEQWMSHWVGYVEESVFDVNMIVIDRHNVIVNGYNKQVFDAFSRYNITPHICNFRHRYFWDGGLHCITSDLDRDGVLTDWFPERNQKSV